MGRWQRHIVSIRCGDEEPTQLPFNGTISKKKPMPNKYSFLLAAFAAFSASSALGCASPVTAPLAFERSNWRDVEELRTDYPSNANIARRQDLKRDGHGSLNIDLYTLTIDANGQSASSLLRELRLNLDRVIFAGTTYAVAPLNEREEALWRSQDPSGAVMVFTLAGIDGVFPLERGAVFVACSTSHSFIFSTLEMSPYGLHPVAGNRAFGVRDNGDGTLMIYTKAADRVVNAGAFSALNAALREEIFSQGDQVWRHMLTNLEDAYSDRNPRDHFIFSERVQF